MAAQPRPLNLIYTAPGNLLPWLQVLAHHAQSEREADKLRYFASSAGREDLHRCLLQLGAAGSQTCHPLAPRPAC